jgi:uncharacterized OsmC-like protein
MNTHTFLWLMVFLVFPGAVLADGVSGEFEGQAIGVIKNGIATRQTPGRPAITMSIDIEAGNGLAYVARRKGSEDQLMLIDEPARRGGTNTGPAPLTYFVAGLGSCLLNQFIRLSIVNNLELAFTKTTVSGDFNRDVGGGFNSFTQTIFAEGAATDGEFKLLAESAGDYCYTQTTLRQVIPMTTILQVNGAEVARQETRPKDFR